MVQAICKSGTYQRQGSRNKHCKHMLWQLSAILTAQCCSMQANAVHHDDAGIELEERAQPVIVVETEAKGASQF